MPHRGKGLRGDLLPAALSVARQRGRPPHGGGGCERAGVRSEVLTQLIQLVIVAWLPGAVLFRLPFADRRKRASLDASERLFWAVIIRLAVSLSFVLIMASVGRYSLDHLLAANLGVAVLGGLLARFKLRLGPDAARPDIGVVFPSVLVLLGAWLFFPPSEYVIGGKDPGGYMNEGIQIAQRGTFAYRDPVVASVPPFARDLFFPSHQRPEYYGLR